MKRLYLGLLFCFCTSANAALVGYAGGATPGGIYEINAADGTATYLTGVQFFLATGGMAYLDGTFYVTNYTPNYSTPFYYGSVDITTGSLTPFGIQTSSNWDGFAANQAEGFLYVIEQERQILLRVDPGSGAIEEIGSGFGITVPHGIRDTAYDGRHGILYGTGYYSGDPHLYTIDTTTGVATDVGSLGLPYAEYGGDIPLAYDDRSGVLYAADSVARSLYTVDVLTGNATLIGYIGVPMGSMVWYEATVSPMPVPGSLLLLLSGLATGIGLTARQERTGAPTCRPVQPVDIAIPKK